MCAQTLFNIQLKPGGKCVGNGNLYWWFLILSRNNWGKTAHKTCNYCSCFPLIGTNCWEDGGCLYLRLTYMYTRPLCHHYAIYICEKRHSLLGILFGHQPKGTWYAFLGPAGIDKHFRNAFLVCISPSLEILHAFCLIPRMVEKYAFCDVKCIFWVPGPAPRKCIFPKVCIFYSLRISSKICFLHRKMHIFPFVGFPLEMHISEILLFLRVFMGKK